MKIKVMTFNLRVPVKRDGANHFSLRKSKIRDTILRESPDLIGFQEATDGTLAWLKETLTDYYIVGHGREWNYHGEGGPIAFRKDRFSLCGFRQKWLSLEPHQPGSRFEGLDQDVYPRVYCCAELIHRDGDRPIAFYNVHGDSGGDLTRTVESALLMRDIAANPYRFVLTGDFNARPNDPSISLITATENCLGTKDLTAGISRSAHGFGDPNLDKNCKIDYIFSNLPADAEESYLVDDDDSCGNYYSDHYALCAFVEI